MQIHRGTIISYDATNHVADVRVHGSLMTVLEDVPVAHHLGAELLTSDTFCALLMSAEGDLGVVVATWDGAPDAWVTSALIVDGEVGTADLADGAVTSAKIADGTIVVADLAFDPATQTELDDHEDNLDAHHAPPFHSDVQETTDQTVTTTATKYQGLGVTVAPGSGTTWKVAAVAYVEFKTSAFTASNDLWARIYEDSSAIGRDACHRCLSVNERTGVMCSGDTTLTSTKDINVKVRKSGSQNTHIANRGSLLVIYWRSA